MIIAIDFDGTIVRGEYPGIDGFVPDAKEYIQKLYNDGHYIIINTCRSNDYALDAVNYLLEHGVPFHRINDNNPDQSRRYNNNSRKIYAHRYIDDKNIGSLPPWSEIYQIITNDENSYQNK